MKTWKGALIAAALGAPALAHTGPALVAAPSDPITVDGAFDDWPEHTLWEPLPHTGFGAVSGPDDLSGRFAVAFNAEAGRLYIALEVQDDVIVREPQAASLPVLRTNPDGALVYLDLLHRGTFTETVELSWVRRPLLAVDQALMPDALFDIARVETASGAAYEFSVDLRALNARYDRPFRPEMGLDALIGLNIEYWDRDAADDGAVLRWTTGPRDGEDSRRLGDVFLLADGPAALQRVEGRAAWREPGQAPTPRQVAISRAGDPDFTVWAGAHPDGTFHVKLPPGAYVARAADPATLLSASETRRIEVAGHPIRLVEPIFTRPDGAPLDQLIPAMMTESGVRTVGVAWVEDGALAYARTFGVEADGDPASEDTVFRVASITKPVSAAAVFSLAANDRWSLDEPLANHWVDPDLDGDPRVDQLTSRLAMRHLTGLPNWRGGRDLHFVHDPGRRQSYSGEGYEWMRRAIERGFDESFQTINAREVFAPAGMTRTSHGWPDGVEADFAGEYFATGSAVDHSTWNEPNAAANLPSTPTDLARFAIWFMDTRAGLSEAQWADMATANARALIPEDGSPHGLSWLVHTGDDRLVLEHSGGQWGIRTHLILLPEENRALVVLTNSSAGWPLIARIFDATLNADGGLSATAEQLYGGSDR